MAHMQGARVPMRTARPRWRALLRYYSRLARSSSAAASIVQLHKRLMPGNFAPHRAEILSACFLQPATPCNPPTSRVGAVDRDRHASKLQTQERVALDAADRGADDALAFPRSPDPVSNMPRPPSILQKQRAGTRDLTVHLYHGNDALSVLAIVHGLLDEDLLVPRALHLRHPVREPSL
mmetsp:Transcript_6103/g.12232  ORF Transcript_6103/g.12232 Transcript_6103/m.12232 type:complete len:179 (-) Transcript_6103:314-850(-)